MIYFLKKLSLNLNWFSPGRVITITVEKITLLRNVRLTWYFILFIFHQIYYTVFSNAGIYFSLLQSVLKDIDSILYVDTDTLFLGPLEDVWFHFSRMNATQMAALAPEHEDPNTGWYNRFARHPYYGELGKYLQKSGTTTQCPKKLNSKIKTIKTLFNSIQQLNERFVLSKEEALLYSWFSF